jgi:hypothetical protein
MWKYENAAQHMIIIIVPNVLISKRNYWLLLHYINNFKALLFQISYGNKLLVAAERLAVTTDSVVDGEIELSWLCL